VGQGLEVHVLEAFLGRVLHEARPRHRIRVLDAHGHVVHHHQYQYVDQYINEHYDQHVHKHQHRHYHERV